MKYRYRVKQGNCIAISGGPQRQNVLLKPGDFLPDDYPQKKAESLLRERKVEAVNITPYPDFVADVPVADPPGTNVARIQTTRTNSELDATRGNPYETTVGGSMSSSTSSGISQLSSPKKAGKQAVSQRVSPWDVDPSTIKGKSLDELNVMILERDANQQPCTTVEEAIAFLSQDFKPSKVTTRQ